MPSAPEPLLNFLLSNEPSFTTSRLPSLYSDLTVQKQTNPEGYTANASAWTSVLIRLALASQLPFESLFILHTNEDLLSALASRQYGKPVGLGVVLDDAAREGKMLDLPTFLGAENSIYKKSWIQIPSVGEVVRWSLRQIRILSSGSYDVQGRLRNGELVILPALEDIAKRVMAWQEKRPQSGTLTGRIWSREEFVKEISSMLEIPGTMKAKDMDVLLRHLSRDRGVLSYNETTIKFKSPTSQAPEPITQEDTSIANLHALTTSLSTQIQHLETQISALQQKAATAVKNKTKSSAMAALRSKSLATKQLERRQATLQQLEEVYAQIEQAADQVAIVSTLRESADMLKSLNKKVGGVEKVEDVLDELREEMGKTSEVQGVLQEPLVEDGAIAEEEVDEEFEEMEREEREKREREESERTRVRLAELERIGKEDVPGEKEELQGIEREKEKQKDEMDVEAEFAKSVERLEGLKLGEKEKERADLRPVLA